MSAILHDEPLAKTVAAPETSALPAQEQVVAIRRHLRGRLRKGIIATGAITGVYVSLALVVLPACWGLRYRNFDLDDAPRITWAGKHPGDPLNVALVGNKDEICFLFLSADWQAADPVTYKTAARMAKATLFKKPYPTAPISNLYLREGKKKRKQDLYFELCVDNAPIKRHHVRFWQTDKTDEDGRHLWIGSATFDRGAKFNWLTLGPTHAIASDVDWERDKLFADLRKTAQLLEVKVEKDFHKVRDGRNGGNDRWFTDGQLHVGVISPDNVPVEAEK
jgi:hypothetical protein